eukprot:5222999-Amphidinium_carterae.1
MLRRDFGAHPDPMRLYMAVEPLASQLAREDLVFGQTYVELLRNTNVQHAGTNESLDSFVNGLERLLHSQAIRETETARVTGNKRTKDWETNRIEANGVGKGDSKGKGKDGKGKDKD